MTAFGSVSCLGSGVRRFYAADWRAVLRLRILSGGHGRDVPIGRDCAGRWQSRSINAASASFYPTSMRSTGVGWALGVGRIGSIVGPVLGGVLLSMTWTPQQILLSGTVPALCAVAAVLISNLVQTSASAYRSAASPGESS